MVVLVQYGDSKCLSGQAYSVLKERQQNLCSSVDFVFCDVLLTQLHLSVQPVLRTVGIAAPGKSWKMYNLLFKDQQTLAIDCLVKYALALGLDISQCLRVWLVRVAFQVLQEDRTVMCVVT